MPLKKFPPEVTVCSGGLIFKPVGFIGFERNRTLKLKEVNPLSRISRKS
jgi:hypothetical protein